MMEPKRKARGEDLAPLTLLEKWRRKAFELTKQLVAMEVLNEKDRANFQAMEASILKQFEDKNAKIKATEQENR
jgi:hypothetical protein